MDSARTAQLAGIAGGIAALVIINLFGLGEIIVNRSVTGLVVGCAAYALVIRLFHSFAGGESDVPLTRAAGRGQYETVLALLTKQPSLLNSQDTDGVTALMAASAQGHLKLVTELLERGADMTVRTKGEVSLSAFLLGVQGGHIKVVEALLAKGADINDRDSGTGMTALMVAAAKGHVEIVRLLLSRGADPSAKSKEGHSAMTFARKDEKRYSKDQLRPYMEIAELLRAAGPQS